MIDIDFDLNNMNQLIFDIIKLIIESICRNAKVIFESCNSITSIHMKYFICFS